jgi:hypothetical protein
LESEEVVVVVALVVVLVARLLVHPAMHPKARMDDKKITMYLGWVEGVFIVLSPCPAYRAEEKERDV